MKSELIIRELKKVEDLVYAEQPLTISSMLELVKVLKLMVCEHQWKFHVETATNICDKCGSRVVDPPPN